MELHNIIRKRWEPGSILLVSEAENTFVRNDILDLLDTIDKLTVQRDALAAAVNKFMITHEKKGINPLTTLPYIIDCECDVCEQARAALALVAADTAGQQEAA